MTTARDLLERTQAIEEAVGRRMYIARPCDPTLHRAESFSQMTLDHRTTHAVAAVADCHPKTVARFLRGEAVRSANERRIREALEKLAIAIDRDLDRTKETAR